MRTSFHSLYNTNKLFVKALIALGMFLFLSVGLVTWITGDYVCTYWSSWTYTI